MRHGRLVQGLIGVTLLLGGCVSPQQQAENTENLLAAAGFTARPANTPERAAMLRNLPPARVVQRARGDRFVYMFADPLVCSCLYIGDQAAYGRYRQELLQRQIANEAMMSAQMNEDAAWNWGGWGPGWWAY
jgi:hypothetical protein